MRAPDNGEHNGSWQLVSERRAEGRGFIGVGRRKRLVVFKPDAIDSFGFRPRTTAFNFNDSNSPRVRHRRSLSHAPLFSSKAFCVLPLVMYPY